MQRTEISKHYVDENYVVKEERQHVEEIFYAGFRNIKYSMNAEVLNCKKGKQR